MTSRIDDPFGLDEPHTAADPFGLDDAPAVAGDPFGLDETPKKRKGETTSERLQSAEEHLAAGSVKLGRNLEQPPPRGLGDRIIDVLSAPNYAETKFIDSLLEGVHPNQALELAAQEALDAMTGSPKAARMRFGDLMEKHGIGEGMSIADVTPQLYNETGQGWKLKKGGLLDLSVRDAFGATADIALDPVTYLSFGAGTPFHLATEGGRVSRILKLSKEGTRVAGRLIEQEMPTALRRAAMLAGEKDLSKIAPEVLTNARQVDLLADELARSRAADRILELSKQAPHLLDEQRFMRFAGSKVVNLEPLAGRVSRLAGIVKGTPIARQLSDVFGPSALAAREVVDRLANSVLREARRIPGWVDLRAEQRALARRGIVEAEKLVNDLTRGWDKVKVDLPTWRGRKLSVPEYVQLHLDNPTRYDAKVLPQVVRDQLPKIRGVLAETWDSEVQLGWIGPRAWRENYAPRYYGNERRLLEQLSESARPSPGLRSGTGITAHGEERVFGTLDEAMDFAEQAKKNGRITWTLRPTLDIRETLMKRLSTHAEALSMDVLERKAHALYSVSKHAANEAAFKAALPEVHRAIDAERGRAAGVVKQAKDATLRKAEFVRQTKIGRAQASLTKQKAGITAAHAQGFPVGQTTLDRLDKTVSRVGALLASKPHIVASDVARLGAMDRALYTLGAVRGAATLDEAAKVIFANRRVLRMVDSSILTDIRRVIRADRSRLVGAWNEPYGPVVLEDIGTKWLPRGIVNDIARLHEHGAVIPKELGPIVQTYDLLIDFFKAGVTSLSPAYHMRNHYSNVAQAFLGLGIRAFDPIHAGRVAGIMAGREGTLNTPLRSYTLDQVRRLANKHGILSADAGIFERSTGRNRIIDSVPFRAGRKLGTTFENHAKLSLFVADLERGLAPEAAAARVRNFLFDYDEISPLHRDLIKRLIPFSVWTTKNIGLQAHELFVHPGRVLAIQKAGERHGPEDSALPEYLNGDFKVRVQRQGKAFYIQNIDLPFNGAANRIWAGDFESTARPWLGSLAPLVTTLPQLATGQIWFSGQSLDDREAVHGLNTWLAKTPVIRDYLEWNTRDNPTTGESEYTVNRAKLYLTMKSWAFTRLYSDVEKLARHKEVGGAVLSLLTGTELKEFDLDEEEAQTAKNKLKRLERSLIRAGEAKQLKRVYYPKAKEEEAPF